MPVPLMERMSRCGTLCGYRVVVDTLSAHQPRWPAFPSKLSASLEVSHKAIIRGLHRALPSKRYLDALDCPGLIWPCRFWLQR